MNYYIRTKNELTLELSRPYETREAAEEKLSKMHLRNRDKSAVIPIPEIKLGLRLYRNGKYWRSIIGESSSVFFCNRTDDQKEQMDDAYMKDSVLRWFTEQILDPVEEYEENYEFTIIKGFSSSNEVLEEEDEEEIEEEAPDV